MQMKQWILAAYDRTIDLVIFGLVLVMIAVLLLAFVHVLIHLSNLIATLWVRKAGEKEFRELVGNLLGVFVIVELFGTFTNYIRTHHVRISMLLDVTIVFALRELLVRLYAASFPTLQLIGLCAIIIILVIARSITTRFSPLSIGSSQD